LFAYKWASIPTIIILSSPDPGCWAGLVPENFIDNKGPKTDMISPIIFIEKHRKNLITKIGKYKLF